MKQFPSTSRLELAVAAFCAWQASALLTAWRHSPLDRLGWLTFLVWLAPVFNNLAKSRTTKPQLPLFSVAALALTVAGRLLDLNALLCAALAISLTALLLPSPRGVVWLAGALAWMPAFGWLAHALPVNAVAASRLILATVASGWLLLPPRTVRPA